MKEGIRIGLSGEYRIRVEEIHLIDFMGAGVPGVLATPWLVSFMERSAQNALVPFMEDNEASVGTEVQIEHFSPTPVGAEVICTAKVIRVDGRSITFQIEAHDGQEKIGRALHKRFVVNKERFADSVNRKLGSMKHSNL